MTLIEALPARIDLAAYHGDTWAQSFRFTRDGLPLDLTGGSVEAWSRDFEEATLELPAHIAADPTTGVVTIAQPAGGLPPGRYGYDVQLTMADTTVTTWIRGHLDIVRAVIDVAV